MSGFNGRRGPNVSQYLATLNTAEPQSNDEVYPQDDLSLFATTDFFDFDMGDGMQNVPADFDINTTDRKSRAGWQDSLNSTPQDFLNADFGFGDLQNFNSIGAGANAEGANPFQYPLPGQQSITSPTSATSPTSTGARAGEKRKVPPPSVDETARLAAEEDKRRRNTAASARFRVKKKQREQALEKTAKEMTEKAAMLETKVQQLEMENKWLKGLITERDVGGDKSAGVVLGKGDLKELFEKFKSSSEGGLAAEEAKEVSSDDE